MVELPRSFWGSSLLKTMKIENKVDVELLTHVLQTIRKATFNNVGFLDFYKFDQGLHLIQKSIQEFTKPPTPIDDNKVAVISAVKGKKK